MSLLAPLAAMLLAAPKLCVGPPGYAALALAQDDPPASIASITAWPGGDALLEAMVINDGKALRNAGLSAAPPHKTIPAPRIYLLDADSDAALPAPDYWPLPDGEVAAFLLRYRVPADAKPGRHEHVLRLSADNLARSQEVVVSLYVAEVAASALQPMPAMAGILWPPPGQAISPVALIEGLQGLPLVLWPRMPNPLDLRPSDVDAFASAQAAYETTTPLNLGEIIPLAEAKEPLGLSARVDALKLERWPRWAQEAIWSRGAFIEMRVAGGEDATEKLTSNLIYWKELWPQLHVLLVGPYMPTLQPYASAWALPRDFAVVIAPLAMGHASAPTSLLLAASSDSAPYPSWPELKTAAAFALDGSESTWWHTPPGTKSWIELQNAGGGTLTSIQLVADYAPEVVQAALPGQPFGDSSVSWTPQDIGHWKGAFRYPAAFARIRLQFPSVKEGARIREISLAGEPAAESEEVPRVSPWMIVDSAMPHAALHAVVLGAEAAGCEGLYLPPYQLRDIRLAIEPQRPGAAPVIAYLDGDRLHPSVSTLYLASALRDAALLRSLRRSGRLGAATAANYLALAQQHAFPPHGDSDPLEQLKDFGKAREDLLRMLEERQ